MSPVERFAKRYLTKRGYRFHKDTGEDYLLYDYRKADGSFDYDRYRKIQEETNIRKIENVWADQPTIEFISGYLKSKKPNLTAGICHGVRRGNEQRWFSEALGIPVIGTDISSTAEQFPNTVQWDFHDRKEEWVGAFDFVYTNSHDHAYDPKKAIDAWIDQLTDDGMVFLEHTIDHSESGANEADPFGVDARILPYLITQWGEGRYAVTEVLHVPHRKPKGMKIWVIVIRKLK